MESYKPSTAPLLAVFTFGFATVLFVLRWVLVYREGLAWDGGQANFNWHPVLQLSGFIFLNGIAIISFRLPWTQQLSKDSMKYLHAGLNLIALICALISFRAVFGSQASFNFPDLFSLHSWLGLTAVALFSLQMVLSACIFLLPVTSDSLKEAFMPLHTFLGRFLFGSTIAISLTGITERLIFGLEEQKYMDSPPEAGFANIMGLLLVAYGVAVFWISTQRSWKRPGDPVWRSSGLEDKIK